MRSTLLRTAVALAVFGAVSVTGVATAGTRAETSVTIHEENGDFHGQVKSPRPNRCADNRKVVLYKQKGRRQRPSRDRKIASDTSELNGDRYEWSTGNTGLSAGKFYARAPQTPDCQADNSKTVRISQPASFGGDSTGWSGRRLFTTRSEGQDVPHASEGP